MSTVASYLIKVTVHDREPTPTRVPGQFKQAELVVPLTIEEIENLLTEALSFTLGTKVGVSAERTDI